MLIILAGITLNAVIGEDGIIFQAKDTKNLISNETAYDNQQLAQLQNELKDNQLYSGIGIIPGTDTGGSSEGGENGTIIPGGGNQQGGTNQGGTDTNTSGGDNTNTGSGDNENKNATVKPANSQNQNPGGGTLVGGKTDEDPLIYVVSGEEIAASFYQSDVTIQIYTKDRTKKIKYILTTTVPEISNELYPSGLVRELDIENGGTLTFTKDGEYTITAYAYDTAGNKSNPTIMWLKRKVGGSTTGGITVSVASGNEGANNWYTSNVTLRVLGTDTGSSEVRYRVRGTATSTGVIGDKEVLSPGNFDSEEVKIANGTTFRIVADGTYTITAYSYDAGGMRLSSSEVLTIQKDATRPTVKSFTGEQITGSGFKVKVVAEDTGSKLTSSAYTYRHKESSNIGEYTSSDPTGTAEKLYIGLDPKKTYDMYVMIQDQAGNIAITDVIARPSLWVSAGTAGETATEGGRSYYRSNTVTLSLRGQDSNNVDISKTTYQVLGTPTGEGSILGNTVTVGTALPTNDEYQLGDKETRTIQLQADGNWTVKVHNYNKEGKLVSTNVVDVTRDITPPTITSFIIGTITFGTTGSGKAIVGGANDVTSGLASKNDIYTFCVGNTSKATQVSNTYTYPDGITASAMPKVIVKDKAGNTSESELTGKIPLINFNYAGIAQSIKLPAGKYKLEVWGAQGGDGQKNSATGVGGRGGYSIGTLTCGNLIVASVYVGGTGGDFLSTAGGGGWNGGGRTVGSGNAAYTAGGGGGGSDIRVNGDSYYHRVIVAGGGGGYAMYNSSGTGVAGVGGGVTGGASSGTYVVGGGSSSAAGSNGAFGVGGVATGNTSYSSGGGGGGWYGGGAVLQGPGGGGSGYVLTSASYKPAGYALGSEYYLTNAQTIAGNQSFPAPGGGNETGHSGNGYARITLVE